VTKFQQQPPNQHAADAESKEDEIKRMTLSEYEEDFKLKMESEVRTFRDCLRTLASVAGQEQFIFEICCEVETPFLSISGEDLFEGIGDAGLKAQLQSL
jgi:hypothetical protein